MRVDRLLAVSAFLLGLVVLCGELQWTEAVRVLYRREDDDDRYANVLSSPKNTNCNTQERIDRSGYCRQVVRF
uniref:Uncharacterized protein n=1 Tax=Anopheles minimus TaxID=112268 RepID=A0A182W687_9DIPT